MKTVAVNLGARSYDIVIGNGVLTDAGTYIGPILKNKRVGIVTDETVASLHLKTLQAGLEASGIECHAIILPPGEAQKSFSTLEKLMSELLAHGYERSDYIIAFGGGVIGDLTGFATSMLKRGCGFIQIPTTLLAQVDSSVGGKTAINTAYGKNLVGAFYQPALVLADIDVLSTLPARELKAGYAEVLKYGLLGNVAFFDWLDENGLDVLSLDPAAISHAIAVSCETKAKIVAEDEFEHGRRALLNLGHTFGHALELEAGYSGDLLHGEAVSAGMEMAFAFSAAQGLCRDTDVKRVQAHLEKTDLTSLDDVSHLLGNPDALLTHMDQDKKNEGGTLTLILANKIGEAFVQKGASSEAVKAYLTSVSERYHAG